MPALPVSQLGERHFQSQRTECSGIPFPILGASKLVLG